MEKERMKDTLERFKRAKSLLKRTSVKKVVENDQKRTFILEFLDDLCTYTENCLEQLSKNENDKELLAAKEFYKTTGLKFVRSLIPFVDEYNSYNLRKATKEGTGVNWLELSDYGEFFEEN